VGYKLLFSVCMLMIAGGVHAQTPEAPILEKMISIEFKQESPEKVLERISNLGDFSFSFNPALIENRGPVSLRVQDQSIRQVLDRAFDGTLIYKEKNRYVILLHNPATNEPKPPGHVLLSGYVNDAQSGLRVAGATVFERRTLAVTNTDAYGHFQLRVNDPNPPFELAVFRNEYRDTTWIIGSVESANQSAVINLQRRAEQPRDSAFQREIIPVDKPIIDTIYDPKPQLFPDISLKKLVMWNVTDTLNRIVQVSFVPFLGTNGMLSGNVTNEFSLNLIGGYSMANTKLELGGVFNANRGDVSGVQLAGSLNLVGGGVDGLQAAGVANLAKGASKGVALAGVFNLHSEDHSGMRAAGVLNYAHKSTSGLSIAGVLNHQSGNNNGGQIAGALNVAMKDVTHGQLAGALNVATGDVGGGQIAGAVNFCSAEVKGAQIAGVLNVAKKVKGVQLGLVNIADSVGGIPLGFLSYVHKGYHHAEVSTDESFRINVAFHSGVQALYNIFAVGLNPENPLVWYYGYGLGTSPKLSKRLNMNIQLTSNWINEEDAPLKFILLNRLQVGVDYRFAKHFSVFAGGVINGLLTETDEPLQHFRLPSEEFVLYDENYSDDLNLKFFPGVRTGVRIWW